MKKLILFLASALILVAGALAFSVTISPDIAYNDDNLYCVADSAPDTFLYKWYNGDMYLRAGQTLESVYTAIGQTYTCKVYFRPTQWNNEILMGEVSRIILSNSAPTTPVVGLSAGQHYFDSSITATAFSTDADGDSLTVFYEAFLNGNSMGIVSGAYGMVYIVPFSFKRGDVIIINSWTNDGKTNSNIGMSTLAISNYIPLISSFSYSPLSPGYTDTLRLNVSASDKDNDSLSYAYQFENLNDNVILQAYSATSSYTLNSNAINDTIRATVRVTDGMDAATSYADIFVKDIATAVKEFNYCSASSASSPVSLKEITNDDKIEGKKFNPLDEIEIKAKIENNDDEDEKDIIVQAVLVGNGTEIEDTDVEKEITIDEDDEETVILTLIIPEDIGEGNYQIYVKAYDDDNSNNCQQQALNIKIEKNSHEVIFKSIDVPQSALSGSTMTVEGTVANIGKEDEEQVKITCADGFGNSLYEEKEDLDAGDTSQFSFNINVPEDASGEKSIKLRVYYEYDDDDESYDESSDEESYKFSIIESGAGAFISSQDIVITSEEQGFELSKWLDENWLAALIGAIEVIVVIYLVTLIKSRI